MKQTKKIIYKISLLLVLVSVFAPTPKVKDSRETVLPDDHGGGHN